MKCLVLLAVAVPFVAAAAPLTIAHQGRLLAADGTALNGAHTLRMRLYDGASAVLYEDTFSGVDVQDGYFTVVLGSGVSLTRDVFQSSPVLLGIKVDADAELPVRQELHSAPYAISAGGVTLGDVTVCDASATGTLRWSAGLSVCDGTAWQRVRTGRDGSPASPGLSCDQIHQDFPGAVSGTFYLDPTGAGAVPAYCEMALAGGGWTRVMTTDGATAICSLTAPMGTAADVAAGAGTAWWAAPDVDAMGFSQVMIWDSGSNYARFTSAGADWTWANIANGTINSFTHAGVTAARNADAGFTPLVSQGCAAPGCLLGGGYNGSTNWTPILGIGANGTGGFVQDAACASANSQLGLYGGFAGGDAWNANGYAYVR